MATPDPPSWFSPTDAPQSCDKLHELAAPHVESFNFFLDGGLRAAVADIPFQEVQVEAEDGSTSSLRLWLEDVQVAYPMKDKDDSTDKRLFPRECRERGLSYTAPLQATICTSFDQQEPIRVQRRLGNIPIMVRSSHCHLAPLGAEELVQFKEDANEFGGYFICNGIERIIRMLQIPRRNHIMAITRPSYRKRGPEYSDKGVMIRCVRPDQSSLTLTLHYLVDGNAMLRFTVKKQEFFLPAALVMRALQQSSDRELYERVVAGDTGDRFLADRVELMLREAKRLALFSRQACLAYIGARFRVMLDAPDSLTDAQAGMLLLQRYVLVHLSSPADKLELLVVMLRKLYAFVSGRVAGDNQDAVSSHELLLPGHLYLMFLKEKLSEMLSGVRASILKESRSDPHRVKLSSPAYVKRHLDRQSDIGRKLMYMMSTGNIVSTTGLDLMQVSGFTIVADRINWFRYMSHFRSVHRGSFFTTMKTTAVRKLLPEAWGFLCPVHTPDGSPCGLLNHLAAPCVVMTHPQPAPALPAVMASLGMVPAGTPSPGAGVPVAPRGFLPVLHDGRVLGWLPPAAAPAAAAQLRAYKVAGARDIPPTLEIAYIPPHAQCTAAVSGATEYETEVKGEGKGSSGAGLVAAPPATDLSSVGAFPGLFLFTGAARMLRPVKNLRGGGVELVGPMEQLYLEVAVVEGDRRPSSTHQEISPMHMLSLIASLTPFSDHNQSPRNMYQCQMGKQTMGTPAHALSHRCDSKLYRLQTPQAPLVQNRAQGEYKMDEYPNGTNAVVAVISYTGYDMEDAMILNKSSYERGFAHASVYKTKVIDLSDDRPRGQPISQRFSNLKPGSAAAVAVAAAANGGSSSRRKRKGKKGKQAAAAAAEGASELDLVAPSLDIDGLPPVGLRVTEGDPLYCVVDSTSGKAHVAKHKDSEAAMVQEVRALGSADDELQRVSLKLRYPRNPIVGDKFSSRHGQKGVLSVLWPQRDMPFSESGMSPDIIINPHAFPSRMTIGMLIESMAGKAGSMHATYQDSTPFRFWEHHRAADYFGEQLRAAGYNYYGSEPLYSGITGTQLQADIFIGVVYYQRLRHMVSDKSQVRATGPINSLTRQPVKGRKRHGGIRFGEMERDSLLAHGAAFLLQDRLLNCSDRHTAHVCKRCRSLLSPIAVPEAMARMGGSDGGGGGAGGRRRPRGGDPVRMECRSCGESRSVVSVAMPYVFRYLANELAAMNIRITLEVK